jgi:DNA-nicking Smr family endonuclease
MKPPRGLSPDEAAAWARVAATVKPMRRSDPPPAAEMAAPQRQTESARKAEPKPANRPATSALHRPPASHSSSKRDERVGLDAAWERKLSRGALAPDFTLDLHGHTLDSAHRRLDHGLLQAKALGARTVLLISGKPRPAEAADRGERRGAIRANVLDWLAAGPHAGDIAAIRKAHRRHGGEGALYLVLKRKR